MRHPKVAMGADGSAVAVWEHDNSDYPGFEYPAIEAATREPGGDWSEPQQLSPLITDSAQPEVAVGASGETIAFWLSGPDHLAVKASSRPPGGAWSATPIPGVDTPWPKETLKVEIAENGDAVAIWASARGKVVEGEIRPAGMPWTYDSIVNKDPEGTYPKTNPGLALAPDGTATVIWATEGHGGSGQSHTKIQAAARRPGQSKWDAPETLVKEATFLADPDIAVARSGQATAAWHNIADGRVAVMASTRPAGSSSWGPFVDLSAGGQDPPGPTSACPSAQEPNVAAGPGGDTTVAWSCLTASSRRFVQARTRPAGASDWGETAELSASTPSVDSLGYRPAPQVAVDARGNSVAIWRLCGPLGVCTIQAAERRAGGAWSAPRDLSSPGQDLDSPADLGSDGSGDVAAVWSGPEAVQGHAGAALAVDDEYGAPVWSGPDPAVDQGQLQVVKAAGYDGSGPQLRGLAIPESGTVGDAIDFSVSPVDVWSGTALVKWDFGDGRVAFGRTTSHTYRRSGYYWVQVTAWDSLGIYTKQRHLIHIST